MKAKTFSLPAGTVCKRGGAPFILMTSTLVECHPENFPLIVARQAAGQGQALGAPKAAPLDIGGGERVFYVCSFCGEEHDAGISIVVSEFGYVAAMCTPCSGSHFAGFRTVARPAGRAGLFSRLRAVLARTAGRA